MALRARPIRIRTPVQQLSSSKPSHCRPFHASGPNQSTSAKSISEAFLSKFASGQTFTRKQFLDANQLRLFGLTLDRGHLWPSKALTSKTLEETEPAEGTPIPPYYHLIYFTPAQLPGILGQDGSDASFNPDPPFTRRMWAGGSAHWIGADPNSSSPSYLRVGDTVTEVTRIVSCEPKVIKKTGESMLVLGLEKEFRDSKDNLCLLDKRNWVFREALDPSKPASLPKKPNKLSASELDERDKGKIVREYNRDVVQLFRMSALTFNAHRIHYDLPWARDVEGHRNVVVHGPLNMISMMDLWRDEAVNKGAGNSRDDGVVYPKEMFYRATSPVYAGEPYRVMMNAEGMEEAKAEVSVVSNDGTVCMKGTIHEW